MELGPHNQNGDGFVGPNFILVIWMDPLGNSEPHELYMRSLGGGSCYTGRFMSSYNWRGV